MARYARARFRRRPPADPPPPPDAPLQWKREISLQVHDIVGGIARAVTGRCDGERRTPTTSLARARARAWSRRADRRGADRDPRRARDRARTARASRAA